MYQSTRCLQTRKIFENPLWEDVFKKPAQVLFDGMNNYTDHFDERNQSTALIEVCERSSVRLSYSKDPATGELKILEENHYYPFGLRHEVYGNGSKMDYKKSADPHNGTVITYATQIPYQYKYQGQERQDELGLNWDSFKWRNYDYAIGRFMSIDPLTEQYHIWTPYAFSGNIVVHARELEGLEPVVMSGNLVGYNVQQGQGPIAIANDINNPTTQKQYGYSISKNISYKDIVSENPNYFTNVTDKNNINDSGYNNLNLNEGDNLSLIKFTAGNLKTELEGQISDLKAENSKLTKELNTVSKAHKEVWKNINETTKQNRAMGGDPRSGADVANYIVTRKERKEAQRLFKEKEKLEKKIEKNNQRIEKKQESVDRLIKVINE